VDARRFCATCLHAAYDYTGPDGLYLEVDRVPDEWQALWSLLHGAGTRAHICGWHQLCRAIDMYEAIQDPTPGARITARWRGANDSSCGIWSVTQIAGTDVCQYHAQGLLPLLRAQYQQALRGRA